MGFTLEQLNCPKFDLDIEEQLKLLAMANQEVERVSNEMILSFRTDKSGQTV